MYAEDIISKQGGLCVKYLYLLRHGETSFNQLKKVQESCDSPLIDLGRQQASWAKKYFEINQIELNHTYSSTQERASDTLEIITSLPYERKKGLKEFAFGRFEGEPAALQPKGEQHFESFYVYYGGETSESVHQRMFRLWQISWIKMAMNKFSQYHTTALFIISFRKFGRRAMGSTLDNCLTAPLSN